MKKKIVLFILFGFICLVGLTGCKKKNVDTYEGSLSTVSYVSKKEAVKGFIEEELNSGIISSEFVDYSVNKKLTHKEIEKLSLSEENKNGLSYVEEVEVKYIESLKENNFNSFSPLSVKKMENEPLTFQTIKIYVLCYYDAVNEIYIFRFYTPALKNGDIVTKSYFESTNDSKKYTSFTVNADIKLSPAIVEDGISVDKIKMVEKLTNDSAYISVNYGVYSTDLYLFPIDGTFYNFSRYNDEEWEISTMPFGQEILDSYQEEMKTSWYSRYNLDYNCFEKSSSGFTLRKDIFNGSIKLASEFEMEMKNFDVKLSEGRLSKMTFECDVKNGQVSYNAKYNLKYSDFDTTTIDIPKSVQERIDAFKNNLK